MYCIKDWDMHFENNKSRERIKCSYVCVPNKQDGKGLIEILSLPDGASIYGIWCLLLGLCSKQRKPRHGYLTDNGLPTGCPLTARDLALIWRRKEAEIARALDVLSSQPVGWIEIDGEVPAKCPPSARLVSLNGIEEKRIEEKRKTAAAPDTASVPPHLSEVWEAFSALRKTKRQPLTKRAVDNILKTLSPFPPEVQVAMIDQSITNGWTGIFPLKTKPQDTKDAYANMRRQ